VEGIMLPIAAQPRSFIHLSIFKLILAFYNRYFLLYYLSGTVFYGCKSIGWRVSPTDLYRCLANISVDMTWWFFIKKKPPK
jgi:hypothetical protein